MSTRVILARAAAALLGVSLAAGCQATSPATPVGPSGTPSATATTYLNSIIDLARANSINRLTIDWAAYRNAVFTEAGAAQTIAELTPAIRVAITMLRDGHSSYRSVSGTTIFVALRSCSAPPPVALSPPSNIGTVAVGAFRGRPIKRTRMRGRFRTRSPRGIVMT